MTQPDPQNPNDGDDNLMSPEELKQWLTEHPEKMAETQRFMEELMERTVRGDFGELTPEVRAAAEAGLAKHRVYHNLQAVQEKFEALQDVMRRPGGSMQAEDRLAQSNALMDEIVDALLETPEPHRTRLLKELLPIREELRALRVDPD